MRLYSLVLLVLLAITPAAGQTSPPTNTPPRALPVTPEELEAADVPMAVPGGVNVHWYGHGFIYLTSSVGIRAAINPFGPDTVHYKFPAHLTADFVLITNESEDHSAADLIFGNPLIFRSVMAVGLNRANGIPFHGISLQRDPSGQGGSNTAFTLGFDGVTFCYLGQVNMPLIAQEKQELGHSDVVFLPVGVQNVSVHDLNEIVQQIGASVIIPINYKTDYSGLLPLRSLEEYMSVTKYPVRKFDSDEIVISRKMLPTEPTIYELKSP